MSTSALFNNSELRLVDSINEKIQINLISVKCEFLNKPDRMVQFRDYIVHFFSVKIDMFLKDDRLRRNLLGDRGEGSRWKTERGADMSRLGRAKNVT